MCNKLFFENWSIFGDDVEKSLRLAFLGHSVHCSMTYTTVDPNTQSILLHISKTVKITK